MIASANKLRLRFLYDGRFWTVVDHAGRQIWCGNLNEAHAAAKGKL